MGKSICAFNLRAYFSMIFSCESDLRQRSRRRLAQLKYLRNSFGIYYVVCTMEMVARILTGIRAGNRVTCSTRRLFPQAKRTLIGYGMRSISAWASRAMLLKTVLTLHISLNTRRRIL